MLLWLGEGCVSTGGQEDEYLIPWLEVTDVDFPILPFFLDLVKVVCDEVLKFGEAFLHEHDVGDNALRRVWACYQRISECIEGCRTCLKEVSF